MKVQAKKYLGQHFLNDKNIASKIVESLSYQGYSSVLEVGPGMGVLTQFLLEKEIKTYVSEIDSESVEYLKIHFPSLEKNILGDFLRLDFSQYFQEPYAVIGNFPYNISTQIVFRILENKNQIPEMVGMFQKEVAERIASENGSKVYGILSVLVQAYYKAEYLFTVHENVFTPPPKVKSAVIRLSRYRETIEDVDDKLFIKIVKAAFNQRRKTLKNSLHSLSVPETLLSHKFLTLRPEQMTVDNFIELAKLWGGK